jgi:hypothetical protein
MPERSTVRRAKKALRKGRAPSTAAGEFVREEIHHVREGKHGARSAKQAVAIGLSKARRAGVPLKPPRRGVSRRARRAAERDSAIGQGRRTPRAGSRRRRRAATRALRREPRRTASRQALSSQARRAAERRRKSARSASARKAARTKGPAQRRAAARKAAATRRRRRE